MLRNGKLDWLGEPPPQMAKQAEVLVDVTFVEAPVDADARWAEAIKALERLAAKGGLPEFGDPVEWQRETRRDRPLPGREP